MMYMRTAHARRAGVLRVVSRHTCPEPEIVRRPRRHPMFRVLRNMAEARWANMADAVLADIQLGVI